MTSSRCGQAGLSSQRWSSCSILPHPIRKNTATRDAYSPSRHRGEPNPKKNPKKKPVAGVTGDRGRTSSQALAPIWIEQWTQQTSNVRVTRRAIKTVLAGAKHMSEQEQSTWDSSDRRHKELFFVLKKFVPPQSYLEQGKPHFKFTMEYVNDRWP